MQFSTIEDRRKAEERNVEYRIQFLKKGSGDTRVAFVWARDPVHAEQILAAHLERYYSLMAEKFIFFTERASSPPIGYDDVAVSPE